MSMHDKQVTCLVCGAIETDRCHIKSKGAGGTMDEINILRLCRIHHIQQHQYGFRKFCDLYPMVEQELTDRGYVFDMNNKLKFNK